MFLAKKNFQRLLALLLVLAMVACALPAGAATKKTPEDVFKQWFALQDKWMVALEDSNFNNDDLSSLIEDIYYNSSMGSVFTMLNMGIVGIVEEEIRDKKDGSYQLDEDSVNAKVTKKSGKYSISFKDGKDSYKVTYSENTGAFQSETKITTGEKVSIYMDIIPARGGIYSSLIVATEGTAPVCVAQYMNDSMVYFTYTEIGSKEDIADYRLTKAPEQYSKLKGKNSAGITLTDSGKLTLEYQEYIEHFQSK